MAIDRVFVMANPAKRKETANGVFAALSKGQIALIEEHPNHPWDSVSEVHRIFVVAGDPPCEAYLTEAVTEKLLQNQLVQMSATDAHRLYKEMTGNAYPGTEPEPEPTPEELSYDAAADAAEAILKKQQAANKRAATIAAKKAAANESTSDDGEDSDLTSDEEDNDE